MIKTVEGSIFDNLPDYSVFLHQCNAKGWMGSGIAAKVAKKWPQVYKEYHEFCGWFKNGHEREIMGTIVSVQVNPKFIVCNAIAQYSVSRFREMTDYDAWETICKKLESQTCIMNQKNHMNWTIHAPEKIGCGLANGDPQKMRDIFEYYFAESPVQLTFYHYTF